MINKIQQFQSEEFGTIDILMIDGKPYFPATDCAKILGYTNPRKAIRDHCKGGTKRSVRVVTGEKRDGTIAYQTITKNFIPEGDLYRLIIRSKLPAAERFEKLVFDEILPTIRKHGAYATEDTLDELIHNPKFAEALIRKLQAERSINKELQKQMEEVLPKARYCDLVLESDTLIPVSLIAKDYGMSAVSFNQLLFNLGMQYPLGGTWLLYQKFADNSYTKTRTYYAGSGQTKIHTYWTEKGRQFIYDFLGYYGIFPTAELDFEEHEPEAEIDWFGDLSA